MDKIEAFLDVAQQAGEDNPFRYVTGLKRRIKIMYGDNVSGMAWVDLYDYIREKQPDFFHKNLTHGIAK